MQGRKGGFRWHGGKNGFCTTRVARPRAFQDRCAKDGAYLRIWVHPRQPHGKRCAGSIPPTKWSALPSCSRLSSVRRVCARHGGGTPAPDLDCGFCCNSPLLAIAPPPPNRKQKERVPSMVVAAWSRWQAAPRLLKRVMFVCLCLPEAWCSREMPV